MALQAIPGGLWIPDPVWADANAPAFSASLLDASTDRVSVVFRIPRTGSIDRILAGWGTCATPATVDYRLEGANTTGNPATPSGSLFGTNTVAPGVTPVADTCVSGTLTTAAAVTRGQVAAIVLQSATTPISANVNRINSQATLQAGGGFPYGQGITSGSTYGATPSIPCVAVRYDTGEWVFIDDAILPIQSFAASAFNTDTGATTGTRRGLRFQLPFPGRLNGCWAKLSFPTTADFDIILYNGAGTALQTMLSAFDANQQRVASTSGLYKFLFDGTYDLAAATEYFLAFVPTTANSLTLAEFAVNAAAHMDAIAGGQAFHLAKFVSSAWSKVTTERPWMGVLVSAFDDGTGGGSSGGGPLIGGRLIQ